MSKVITFSRTFPKGHTKAGQPTYFVEKICNSLLMALLPIYTDDTPKEFLQSLSKKYFLPKHHTIRSGKRWRKGDKFSPRVWSDKPYASKQIVIAPDIEIKRVVDIKIKESGVILMDGNWFADIRFFDNNPTPLIELANNDGLTVDEMLSWFNNLPFSGQILIWNDTNLPY